MSSCIPFTVSPPTVCTVLNIKWRFRLPPNENWYQWISQGGTFMLLLSPTNDNIERSSLISSLSPGPYDFPLATAAESYYIKSRSEAMRFSPVSPRRVLSSSRSENLLMMPKQKRKNIRAIWFDVIDNNKLCDLPFTSNAFSTAAFSWGEILCASLCTQRAWKNTENRQKRTKEISSFSIGRSDLKKLSIGGMTGWSIRKKNRKKQQ